MTTGKVSESIYDDGSRIIPMFEVQHIESRGNGNIVVVMKSTTYNKEADEYNNAVFVEKERAQAFKAAWCVYRSELEAPMLELNHD